MFTKGYMQKKLKEVGVRRINGKKFNEVKTYDVVNAFYDTFGCFTK